MKLYSLFICHPIKFNAYLGHVSSGFVHKMELKNSIAPLDGINTSQHIYNCIF